MGLIVNVYRTEGYDCTNNGVSKFANRLTLTNVDGPFEPTAAAPAAKLVKTRFGNVVIVPDAVADKWTMFGGNIAHTSDSRFDEAVRALTGYPHGFAVNIHDRVEG